MIYKPFSKTSTIPQSFVNIKSTEYQLIVNVIEKLFLFQRHVKQNLMFHPPRKYGINRKSQIHQHTVKS